MNKNKCPRRIQKWHLSLLFATFVFIIMLFTMLFVLAFFIFAWKIGIVFSIRKETLLLYFAIISLIIGSLLALLISKRPLAPIRLVADAADKIADGDYSARVNLRGPDELIRLSNSFNHMAEEIGSVEILRSDFVNNFSHEFKTPIVSIRGFAKMLKRDDLTAEERQEYLDTIIKESERLTELSTNVLNLTKLEQQSILSGKTEFNVTEQIRRVIAMMYSKWANKSVNFDIDCGERYITANEELLKQVWLNLLDNSVKFSPDSSTIKIRMAQKTNTLIVTIADQGIGISQEAARHIFDKFYQGDRSHSSSGNGLGLTIAKRIVVLHGGTISAQNQSKKGTIFSVELPSQ